MNWTRAFISYCCSWMNTLSVLDDRLMLLFHAECFLVCCCGCNPWRIIVCYWWVSSLLVRIEQLLHSITGWFFVAASSLLLLNYSEWVDEQWVWIDNLFDSLLLLIGIMWTRSAWMLLQNSWVLHCQSNPLVLRLVDIKMINIGINLQVYCCIVNLLRLFVFFYSSTL